MSAALRPAAPPPPTVTVPLIEMLAIVREYVEANRFDAADRLLAHVLADQPNHGEAVHLSGFIAFKRNRVTEAASLMETAIGYGANAPRQLCNLAEVYRVLGRIDEGLAMVRRAAAMAPTDAVCHFNEAMLHYEQLETDGCIRAAKRAISLKPDMPEAHMRLGQTHLLSGAFAEGWQEYEWRYRIAGAQPLMPPQFTARGTKPQWDGAALPPGKRLLLIADQGFGDVLMFARFLPWAFGRATDITVACSGELAPLMARMFPGPDYQTRWDTIPDYAAYVPFSGLPRLAGITLEDVPDTMPDGAPYVTPEPARTAAMRAWLAEAAPVGKRVGLVWAGRPTHNNDRNRSIGLSVLAPLQAIPGLTFVSMQKGPNAAQRSEWKGVSPIIDADPKLQTFEDTAALIANLDLVVCVDTSVGHLAGAMGKPAWVMVPYAPDWRWLIGRMDTPWYRSLRLYRQPKARDWGHVVEHIAEDLTAFAES